MPTQTAKCNYSCRQCNHPGAFSGHKKGGCDECDGGCGCSVFYEYYEARSKESAGGSNAEAPEDADKDGGGDQPRPDENDGLTELCNVIASGSQENVDVLEAAVEAATDGSASSEDLVTVVEDELRAEPEGVTGRVEDGSMED